MHPSRLSLSGKRSQKSQILSVDSAVRVPVRHRYTLRMSFTKAALFAVCMSLWAPVLFAAPARVDRQPDGVTLHLESGDLCIQVLSDTVFRVAFARSTDFFNRASIDVISHAPMNSGWKVKEAQRH